MLVCLCVRVHIRCAGASRAPCRSRKERRRRPGRSPTSGRAGAISHGAAAGSTTEPRVCARRWRSPRPGDGLGQAEAGAAIRVVIHWRRWLGSVGPAPGAGVSRPSEHGEGLVGALRSPARRCARGEPLLGCHDPLSYSEIYKPYSLTGTLRSGDLP